MNIHIQDFTWTYVSLLLGVYLEAELLGHVVAAAAAKSLQLCLTLCDPIDSSPPGSPVPGILQARTLERVAISFSNAWKWKEKVKSLSCVWLLATPWTAAYQAPPSMGFSRQEYWSGVPLPSPGHVVTPYLILWGLALVYSSWKWRKLCFIEGQVVRSSGVTGIFFIMKDTFWKDEKTWCRSRQTLLVTWGVLESQGSLVSWWRPWVWNMDQPIGSCSLCSSTF